jgi:hypothetical protein
MMKQLSLGIATVAVAASAFAFYGAASGLKTGERVTPFHPSHVSGPLAGTDNCFPCTFQNRPQVQVWVNGDSAENVAKIATNLQKQIDANKGKEFKAMVVWLTDDVNAAKPILKKVAAQTGAKDVAMAALSKKDDAVDAYKINLNSDVKNTVFAYKNWKVEAAMVNLKADDKGLTALNGAIGNLVR